MAAMNDIVLTKTRASLRHLNDILEEIGSPFCYDLEQIAGTENWNLYKYNGKECYRVRFADIQTMYKILYVLKDAFRPE